MTRFPKKYMCYVYSDEKSDADYTNLALDTLESVGVDFDVEKVYLEKNSGRIRKSRTSYIGK